MAIESDTIESTRKHNLRTHASLVEIPLNNPLEIMRPVVGTGNYRDLHFLTPVKRT
ncbi:hypothetical protein BMS3Bbin07_01394 [bacterium BMS3Bbin07]|nr:hypothetical protein BMS3Bbin07_01394 [bacterium BMS3Bbin07]